MIKIIPILLGVVGSYAVAAVVDRRSRGLARSSRKPPGWACPVHLNDTVFSLFKRL